MTHWILLFVGWVGPPAAAEAWPPHPAGELSAAVRHAEGLPLEARADARYLTLLGVPPADRPRLGRMVDFAVNSASRVRTVRRAERLTPTLLWIDLDWYAAEPAELQQLRAAWEQLAVGDRYLHLETEALDPATGRTRRVVTDGGWVDPAEAARLRAATGSVGALLRADAFVVKATSVLAGGVYYDLIGAPETEQAWFESIGLDLKGVLEARATGAANLAISGVTRRPRRVLRLPAAWGGAWQTLDSAVAAADRSPLRAPIAADGSLRLTYDAGEYIAAGPNGLLRYALYDSTGALQDSVPDVIAKDASDPAADGVLQPAISCVRCHVEGGLRPFADEYARLARAGARLTSSDERLIERAGEFYDQERLQRELRFDREAYEAAVQKTTGLTAAEAAAQLAAVYRDYQYRPLDAEQAAREVGVAADELREALATTRDPVLILLLAGGPALREEWESSYAEAALAAAALRNRGAAEQGPALGERRR